MARRRGANAHAGRAIGRRTRSTELAILEKVRVAGEEEASLLARDPKLGDVLGAHRGHVTDGNRPVLDHRLEDELFATMTEDDPGMPTVLAARGNAPPDDKLGVDAELDQLAPRPEREVLTV